MHTSAEACEEDHSSNQKSYFQNSRKWENGLNMGGKNYGEGSPKPTART